MNRLVIIASIFVILSISAQASDLPSQSSAPKVLNQAASSKAVDWTGCSVGVAGGYAQHDSTTPLAAGSYDGGSHTNEGALVGARLGCDIQFDQIVLGIQGSYDWMNINGRNDFYPVGPGLPEYSETTANWFGTATARAGFLVTPSLLVYVKGGAAWLNVDYSDYDTGVGGPTFIGSATETRSGWTVGGGLDYSINNNWFASVDYTYADFGTDDIALYGLIDTLNNVQGGWTNRYNDKFQSGMFAVRYKF